VIPAAKRSPSSTAGLARHARGQEGPARAPALNVGVPLLQKNPTTGFFTVTIGVEESTVLLPGNFNPFPMEDRVRRHRPFVSMGVDS